jgi:hypothetical protein
MAGTRPHSDPLRADDGSPLEVKEGIVLDRDGTEIPTSAHQAQPSIRIVRLNGWIATLAAPVIFGVLLTAGFGIAAVVLGFFLLAFILRTLLRTAFDLFGNGRR